MESRAVGDPQQSKPVSCSIEQEARALRFVSNRQTVLYSKLAASSMDFSLKLSRGLISLFLEWALKSVSFL